MAEDLKFTQIVNKCFEDPEFREQLISDNVDDRKNALEPYFEDDPEGLEKALGAMNRILDSPARDSITEFFEHTDPILKPEGAF